MTSRRLLDPFFGSLLTLSASDSCAGLLKSTTLMRETPECLPQACPSCTSHKLNSGIVWVNSQSCLDGTRELPRQLLSPSVDRSQYTSALWKQLAQLGCVGHQMRHQGVLPMSDLSCQLGLCGRICLCDAGSVTTLKSGVTAST